MPALRMWARVCMGLWSLKQNNLPADTASAPAAYQAAFQEFGLAVEDGDVETVAAQVRTSVLKEALLAALDDWAFAHTGEPVDRDGKLAAKGRVNETVLAFMLHHPVFLQPPPKSLDRFDFPMAAVEGLSGPDGAATLTAFTAAAIARGTEHLPQTPKRWIICGGGRRNPVLMG